jgi:hypothetical protein
MKITHSMTKKVESKYYRIAMREVAFIPTRKDEICMIRRSTSRRKKISSPEVLDTAASSERVARPVPESHDEEAERSAIDETHLAFSQAHSFNLSCGAGPSPSKNA